MTTIAPKDWTNIHLEYPGQWVAFNQDQQTVIASAKSLKATLNKAQKKGFINPSVFKVPTQPLPYVGQN